MTCWCLSGASLYKRFCCWGVQTERICEICSSPAEHFLHAVMPSLLQRGSRGKQHILLQPQVMYYCLLALETTGNIKPKIIRTISSNSSSLQMKGIQRNSRMTSAMQDNSQRYKSTSEKGCLWTTLVMYSYFSNQDLHKTHETVLISREFSNKSLSL